MGQLGGQFHVVRGQDDGVPLGREAAQDRDQAGLRRVVEAARRLVEQEQRRAGRQHDRQGEREALAFREVTGVGVVRDAGQQPRDKGAAGARTRARVMVGGGALGGHRVRVQEVPRFLRDQADAADQVARARAVRDHPAHQGRAGRRADQADQGGQESGLAGAVAAHQGDDLAGPDREVDVAQRLDAPPPHREPRDLGDGGHPGLLASAAQRGPAGVGGGSGPRLLMRLARLVPRQALPQLPGPAPRVPHRQRQR